MAKTKDTLKNKITHVLMSPVRLIKLVCMWVGATVMAIVFCVSVYLGHIVHSTPDLAGLKLADLKTLATKSVYKKREDKHKKLVWTPIADVNRSYIYSIITSEDAQFFEHDGINIDAITNSLVENIRRREYAYGGSTISQQVSKNLFFENQKTIKRKIQEYLVTKKLEQQFAKNEILELYLNMAELGPDIFGVKEASQHYFGKDPSEINAAEGTFIALMLPSPRVNYYKVYQNQNLTKQSRRQINRVLRDMLFNEYISEAQYGKYVKYPFFKKMSHRFPASKN